MRRVGVDQTRKPGRRRSAVAALTRAAGDFGHIVEMFAAFGPVVVRRMFGGAGIFADGVMIGILHSGAVYLKADEAAKAAFEQEGLPPFTYAGKDGERSLRSFWRMPERLYDEPDELARWASRALECARRGAMKRQRSRPVAAASRANKKAGQSR